MFQGFNTTVISTAMLVCLAGFTGCRPALPEKSRLWSVRTAEDFARLVRQGRKVADIPPSDANGTSLLLTSASTFGGFPTIYLEMDEQNESIIFAQFDVRTMPAVNRSAIDSFTKDFIQKASPDLRIDPSELRPIDLPAAKSNQRVKAFTREISGIPVRDSRLIFIFAEVAGSFRLMEIQNRTFSHLKIATRPNGPRLDQTRLGQVLGASDTQILTIGDSYIVDKRLSPPQIAHATWYQVSQADGKIFTLTFSGGQEPALIEAYSHRTDAVLEAIVYSRSWAGDKKFVPVPELTIETTNGRQLLDAQGQWPGSPINGKVHVNNTWFRGISASGQPTSFEFVTDGARSIVKTDNDEPASITNVYVALARVRAFALKYLSVAEVPFFNQRITITTDIKQTCNAYYQAKTLNFFSKGGNCANMAFVNDVIYHEWGHGLDDHTGPGAINGGGMSDGAFSEGIGDIVAMFMNRDNMMGLGFFTSDASRGIRNLDNKKVYVQGQESGVHAQGTIIGGAFWELRRRMINKYGEAGHDRAAKIFFRHLIEAARYLRSSQSVQRLADDDNHPATRHSDWCLINHAFAAKRLTQEDSCQDNFNDPAAGPESQVFFALGEPKTGSLSPLFVSVAINGAASISVCEGRDACTQPVAVPFLRTTAGIKIFGPVNWNVLENQVINADILDASGKSIAKRVVKFNRK
jgi:hypothetical protein